MTKKNHEHEDEIDIDADSEHEDIDTTETDDEVTIDEEETGADAIKKLRAKLKTCQTERQEYLEGWQRVRAEFANARREDEKRMAELRKHANERLLLDLMPVLDSFDMAFANKEAWEKVDKGWRDGVTYIHSQLVGAMEQYGVSTIDPTGQKFDPAMQTSIEAVPTDDKAQDDMVAQVLSKGYRLHDRIIRPAKVTVYVYKDKTAE